MKLKKKKHKYSTLKHSWFYSRATSGSYRCNNIHRSNFRNRLWSIVLQIFFPPNHRSHSMMLPTECLEILLYQCSNGIYNSVLFYCNRAFLKPVRNLSLGKLDTVIDYLISYGRIYRNQQHRSYIEVILNPISEAESANGICDLQSINVSVSFSYIQYIVIV